MYSEIKLKKENYESQIKFMKLISSKEIDRENLIKYKVMF